MSGVSSMGAKSKAASAVSGGVSSMGTRGSSASVNASTGVGSVGIKRTAGTNPSTRSRTSSRLLAPTASSLAKAQGSSMRLSPSTEQVSSVRKSPGLLSSVSENQASGGSKPALGQITNSPSSVHPQGHGKIFSQPLSPSTQNHDVTAVAVALAPKPLITAKTKLLPTRKPRISRSKVIAKLASQRTAGFSSSSGKTRSSMGAGKRQSMGGAKMGRGGSAGAGDSGVMMSAKKRARQSEYARRRSRAVVATPAVAPADGPSGSGAMNVDG